jgi:hypothetical protein
LDNEINASPRDNSVILLKAQLNEFCTHVKHIYSSVMMSSNTMSSSTTGGGGMKKNKTMIRRRLFEVGCKVACWHNDAYYAGEVILSDSNGGGGGGGGGGDTELLPPVSWYTIEMDKDHRIMNVKSQHVKLGNSDDDDDDHLSSNSKTDSLIVGDEVYIPIFDLDQDQDHHPKDILQNESITKPSLEKGKIISVHKFPSVNSGGDGEGNAASTDDVDDEIEEDDKLYHTERFKYNIKLEGTEMVIPFPDYSYLVQVITHREVVVNDKEEEEGNKLFLANGDVVYCELDHVRYCNDDNNNDSNNDNNNDNDTHNGGVEDKKEEKKNLNVRLYRARVLSVRNDKKKTRPIYEVECIIDGQLTRHKNIDNHHHHHHKHKHHHHHHQNTAGEHHNHHHHHSTQDMFDNRSPSNKLIPLRALTSDELNDSDVYSLKQHDNNNNNNNNNNKDNKNKDKNTSQSPTTTTSISIQDDGIEPPLHVGSSVLTLYKNKPGGKYYLSEVVDAKLMDVNEVSF